MSFSILNPSEQRTWGFDLLASVDEATLGVLSWKAFLQGYAFVNQTHELYGWLTCVLALKAVSLGNFGVGSILVDDNQQVVAWGHNQVFEPRFASSQHAEMVVMDRFEESRARTTGMKALTLFTSLESCPMCLARLVTSRIGTVLHLAEDKNGGMVHKVDALPPIWQRLSLAQAFHQADCNQTLKDAALAIFLLNADALDTKLMDRGGQ